MTNNVINSEVELVANFKKVGVSDFYIKLIPNIPKKVKIYCYFIFGWYKEKLRGKVISCIIISDRYRSKSKSYIEVTQASGKSNYLPGRLP